MESDACAMGTTQAGAATDQNIFQRNSGRGNQLLHISPSRVIRRSLYQGPFGSGSLSFRGSYHSGLQEMRERADRIGAQLNLLSGPVSGTDVELTIPADTAYLSPQAKPQIPGRAFQPEDENNGY